MLCDAARSDLAHRSDRAATPATASTASTCRDNPHENLNECIVCRVLWRDPINATPLEIRQYSCSMFYADRFLCMDGRGEGASEGEGVDGAPTPPLPPFPYQAGDFELLEGNDRAACEAVGFAWQIHVIPTYIGSGRGEKRRRPA